MTWWHAYGALVDGAAVDDDGNDHPAWVMVVAADSPVPPTDPTITEPFAWPRERADSPVLPYLTSWDHAPTVAEKNAVTPTGYEDEDEDA